MDPLELLSPADIAAKFQMDALSTRNLLRSPGFPLPTVNLSQKSRRWTRSSIQAWIDDQDAKNAKGLV